MNTHRLRWLAEVVTDAINKAAWPPPVLTSELAALALEAAAVLDAGMITQPTISCALSSLKVAHDSLNEPSVHFSVEIQRKHQAEIRDAIAELDRLKALVAELDRLTQTLAGVTPLLPMTPELGAKGGAPQPTTLENAPAYLTYDDSVGVEFGIEFEDDATP